MKGRRAGVALALVIAVLAGFLLIAAVAWPVLRALTVEHLTTAEPTHVLDEARARFGNALPLIEVTAERSGVPVTVRGPAAEVGATALNRASRRVAYDPRDERLVRTVVPRWGVRLGQWRNVVLPAVGRPDLALTVDDIERHGPGLVLDVQEPGSNRALIWTE